MKIFKNVPNLESIAVDQDVEDYLWEQHATKKLASFLPKLKYINGFSLLLGKPENKAKEMHIRYIMKYLWKFAGTFKLVAQEEISYEPYWYIMDELGCSVSHSDVPNVAICPLLYSASNNFSTDMASISV